MTYPGFATEEGTHRYFQRHPQARARTIGATGLTLSPVGFGGYRIHDRVPENREALTLALRSGCNLIDTSANYGNGGSEILVGQVLSELFEAGELRRDEVVVVTKAGYLQGDNLEIARERAENGAPFPEVVDLSPDCWHCISPEFLDDQISRSAARLQLGTLDFLLLHNPEYFLKAGGTHSEYYRRIRQAFEFLELQIPAGRIRGYGISSNTFPAPKQDAHATSLEAVLELARTVSPRHHFSIAQFPLNLYEPGAVLEENCGALTTAAFARRERIATLVNRPLNAFAHERLFRLADFPPHDPGRSIETFQKALDAALDAESRYPARDLFPARAIAWGHVIRQNFDRISNVENWEELLSFQIRPALAEARAALAPNEPAKHWLETYLPLAEKLFLAMTRHLQAQASQESWRLTELLLAEDPALASSPTLSRKAIRTLLSLEGIDCVLVGMRRPQYVPDALAPALPTDPPIAPESARRILLAIQQSLTAELS